MSMSNNPPAHFYHIWADGAWEEPVNEHFTLLRQFGFTGDVFAGIVGAPDAREQVKRAVSGVTVIAEANTGYEEVTLEALRSWVKSVTPETAVLYSHTKGAYEPSEYHSRWRLSMDVNLLFMWHRHVNALSSVDAIGCHWLEPGVDYGLGDFKYQIVTPFFGGNFWWATAGYLAALPGVGTQSRYEAESWIGTGNPRVIDLSPGWPLY